VEAQRIEERTKNDIEMLREAGYCTGIENYSRYFSGREPGSRPYTLLSFLPKDFLLFVDESHISVPQIRGMFNGDRQRKQTLIDYGFRLPSALDNRPLTFDEFMQYVTQAIFVSATPSEYEYQVSDQVVQQLLRPTGLVDPLIEVRPSKEQVPNLMSEIRQRVERQERVLVTTLTKKSSELLADYLQQEGIKRSICTAIWTHLPVCTSCASCAPVTLTSWWVSTCCAKAWTCQRSRWWRFWMPTRKGSCAVIRRCCRPWAGLPATCLVRSSCTRTR